MVSLDYYIILKPKLGRMGLEILVSRCQDVAVDPPRARLAAEVASLSIISQTLTPVPFVLAYAGPNSIVGNHRLIGPD